MRELVVLGSNSILNPTPNHPSSTPYHHHHYSSKLTKSKPSLHHHHGPPPSRPISTVHSRRLDPTPAPNSSLLKHYTDLASSLAESGRLQAFASITESVITSGVEASSFVAALNVGPVSKGISQNIRQGNVEALVEVLRSVEKLGVPSLKLFDGIAMESLGKECLRLVGSGQVELLVPLMETLSGFGFPIKELAKPSDIVRICIEKRNPEMAVRYVSAVPNERILFCTIINEFGKKGDLDSALTAYEGAKNKSSVPNMYLYRTIIDVCGLCGDYMKSRYIYEDLLIQNITPNIYVFNSLMNVNAHDLSYTLLVYRNMQNHVVTPDVASYNILLKACSLGGRVDLAQDIYREVKQLESAGLLKLDVFTYCTIIKVLADAKLWQMALKVKEDMLSSGVTPNTYTWSSLISACANAGVVEQAIKLFEEMLSASIEPNSQCCNILIHACVEACQYDRAFRLFQSWKGSTVHETGDNCRKRSVAAILSGKQMNRPAVTTMPYQVSNSHPFTYIRKVPFKPTLATYNTLMKACGSDYIRAKSLMEEMKVLGLSPNQISWTILIDTCGASGNVEGSIQILKDMQKAGVEPDVIAYTAAIKVCVETKNLKLAFSLFREMKRYHIKPNLVTYNTLLKARTRYGSLKEIQQCLALYQDMRKAGYKPNDFYLKQLIEEWCEGVIQGNDRSQYEIAAIHKRTDAGRPHTLLLEKVAAHLHTSVTESLAIDLQGLTRVEARIVVLAVLRKIKEGYKTGHSVKDDMWITLGINELDADPDEYKSEVKDAILQLLKKDLGLEVLITVPRFTRPDADRELAQSLRTNGEMIASPRRPAVFQRLKVTRESLHHWLQRKAYIVQR